MEEYVMKKKIWALMSLLIIMAMVLAACTSPTEAPTEEPAVEATEEEMMTEEPPAGSVGTKIGVVLPTKNEPRWLQDEAIFRAALDEAGLEYELLFSEGDPAKEKQNVESLLTQGITTIILTPHDSNAAAASADAVRAAGGKIISYDRLITGSPNVDYYVTFDSVDVGGQMGQFLVDNAAGTGLPLYLYAGAASDNNAFLFFEGAWNKLQPKIADGTFVIKNSSEAIALQDKAELTRDEMAKIIGQITTNWDFNTAKSLAESNLTAAADADKGEVFILAPNDGTSRAIADAFAADPAVTKYWITGQDAETASIQYILEGKQSMTVLKDVRTLVDDAIKAAAAFLAGDTPEATTTYDNGAGEIPAKPSMVVTVTKDNVQTEICDSGYKDCAAEGWTDLLAAPAAEAPEATEAMTTGASTGFCELPENDGKTYALTLWNQWSGDYLEPITAAFDVYMAANPGVTIDLTKPDDVQAALNTAIPAGEGPDIIGWANDHIGDLSLNGIIVPLEEFGVDMAFLESTYEPAAVNGVVLDGTIYALPETQEGIALIYNKAVVTDEYLPTDPTDFQDLYDKAAAFQTATGNTLVCNQGFGGSDAYHMSPVYFGHGVPYYVDTEGNAYMNTPEAVAAATWLQQFATVSLAEQTYDICSANLKEGTVGMWWTGPWAMADLINAGVDFGILQFGKPFVGIKTMMISSNAVDRGNGAAALDVIKWFTSAEVQKDLALVNKTIPAATAGLNDPEVQADPVIAGFGQALNIGVPMSNSPFASCQWTPVGDASLAVWTGAQEPQAAMDAAQEAILTCVEGMK
jgi:ABC-type xylose transport system substrate-binding protein/maltose-binding protein MalE